MSTNKKRLRESNNDGENALNDTNSSSEGSVISNNLNNDLQVYIVCEWTTFDSGSDTTILGVYMTIEDANNAAKSASLEFPNNDSVYMYYENGLFCFESEDTGEGDRAKIYIKAHKVAKPGSIPAVRLSIDEPNGEDENEEGGDENDGHELDEDQGSNNNLTDDEAEGEGENNLGEIEDGEQADDDTHASDAAGNENDFVQDSEVVDETEELFENDIDEENNDAEYDGELNDDDAQIDPEEDEDDELEDDDSQEHEEDDVEQDVEGENGQT